MDTLRTRVETTAVALSTHALAFQRAADALVAVCEQPEHLFPIHYLYGHAIELALKAFLRHRNIDPKVLRNDLGHDLTALVDRVLAEDPADPLGLVDDRRLLIDYLGESYALKGFEYRNVAEYNLIPYADLQPLAAHVVGAVRDLLRAASRAEATRRP